MKGNILVANVWTEYYPGLFANPHEYLLQKEGWDSKTFASVLVANEKNILKEVYFLSTKIPGEINNQSLVEKVISRFQEKQFWKTYSDWVYSHPQFKGAKIIHAHFGQAGVRILPIIKKTKLPLVVSFYGFDISRLLRVRKWVSAYQNMFKYMSAAIVLCEDAKNRLIQLGAPEQKIKIWRIPIELDIYKYEPREYKNEVRFIIAARFVEKKGYPYLFEAFHKLVKMGKNVKLTIIGYGGEKFKVENEIKERKLEKYVRLIDTKLQDSFPQVYYKELKEHDIFVLPSITAKHGDDEAGPALTLVAAQASGLPVICTPFPGSEISVIDGITGLICESENAESLFAKMLHLVDHPEKWNSLGKAGSDLVHRDFYHPAQMNEILNVYQEVIT